MKFKDSIKTGNEYYESLISIGRSTNNKKFSQKTDSSSD